MKRRNLVQSLIAASLLAFGAQAQSGAVAIQLHGDLEIKAGHEEQLVADFNKIFLPLIRKAPGFIDAKLLKFRKANVGKAPEKHTYRLVQIFDTEESRIAWTKTPEHKKAWGEGIQVHVPPGMEVYLFDIRAESKRTR